MTPRNGCAQAATAWLLRHWTGEPHEARKVYRAHPPDTPFALLGTTPWRLEQILRDAGFAVARWWGEEGQAEARLCASLEAERPVVVLLDNARLGGRLGYHYVVATRADDAGVTLENMVRTRYGPGGRHDVPWEALRRAWGSWAPGPYRWAGLEADPAALVTGAGGA